MELDGDDVAIVLVAMETSCARTGVRGLAVAVAIGSSLGTPELERGVGKPPFWRLGLRCDARGMPAEEPAPDQRAHSPGLAGEVSERCGMNI
jgi:hypothetical protein